MKTKIFTLTALIMFTMGSYAQVTVFNFEDETVASEKILHMHTDDWQTDPAYTRLIHTVNPDKTGVNKTEYCASFSGFSSADNWWYGLDIVMVDSIPLTDQTNYLHFAMMVSTEQYDNNRGMLFGDANEATSAETWFPITGEWADYVVEVPDGFENIKELRFMMNHQADCISYLDEIILNNDSEPRSEVGGDPGVGVSDNLLENALMIYSGHQRIQIVSTRQINNLEVYNMLGSLVEKKQVNASEVTIHLPDAGIYVVRIDNYTKKVFVQ